jgi:hypothetical protein
MNLDTVTQDILEWTEHFLEVPNPALGNWSPCPYARRARLNRTVDIRLGTQPTDDLQRLANQGLGTHEVVIFVYDPKLWPHTVFADLLDQANKNFLLSADLLALEDHPDDPEIVNGVSMNQGTYAMAMVQSVSDLNAKAHSMAQKGFYNTWPEEYLQQLFQHRKDPRL